MEAVLLSENAHAEGLAAFQASGGRVVTAEDAHVPDVLVDGIVGIGGRPGLKPEAEAALAGSPACRSWRSTCRPESTSTAALSTEPTCGPT